MLQGRKDRERNTTRLRLGQTHNIKIGLETETYVGAQKREYYGESLCACVCERRKEDRDRVGQLVSELVSEGERQTEREEERDRESPEGDLPLIDNYIISQRFE